MCRLLVILKGAQPRKEKIISQTRNRPNQVLRSRVALHDQFNLPHLFNQLCLDRHGARTEHVLGPHVLPALGRVAEHVAAQHAWCRWLCLRAKALHRSACVPSEDHRAGRRGEERGEAFGDEKLVRLREKVEQGCSVDEANATEERSEGLQVRYGDGCVDTRAGIRVINGVAWRNERGVEYIPGDEMDGEGLWRGPE